MRIFASLYIELEQENRIQRRVDALANYFQSAPKTDGDLALSILLGSKIKSVIKKERLGQLACEVAQIQSWMFDECLTHGNNYLDTVSLIVPSGDTTQLFSLQESLLWLETMSKLNADECIQRISNHWSTISVEERIVFNQMLCGVFKFNVSFDELTEALSQWSGIEKGIIGIRLSKWIPMKSSLSDLLKPSEGWELDALPGNFHTRLDWTNDLEKTIDAKAFHAKWLLDGIDVQVLGVKGEVFIWCENQKLLWNRFPEVESFFLTWAHDFIVLGTLVGWGSEGVDKVVLQKREGKKNISSKVIADYPIRLIISEVRRRKGSAEETKLVTGEELMRFLERMNKMDSPFIWNEEIEFSTWVELFAFQSEQRLRGSLGLAIRPSRPCEDGLSKRAYYVKWNPPYSLNLILLYVKSGTYSGDRSGEEYTFGIRHDSSYLPIARASSLQDEEERTFIKDFVKKNTVEKFGPVRNVKPVLVFQVSFTSIFLNARKKSGVELVNANVICRLDHIAIDDAHQMQDVLELLPKA